ITMEEQNHRGYPSTIEQEVKEPIPAAHVTPSIFIIRFHSQRGSGGLSTAIRSSPTGSCHPGRYAPGGFSGHGGTRDQSPIAYRRARRPPQNLRRAMSVSSERQTTALSLASSHFTVIIPGWFAGQPLMWPFSCLMRHL